MSSQLVWELVKNNNAFLRKSVNHTVFSAEPGNLANKSSYKYSGLANLAKTVDVSAAEGAVVIAKSSKKGKLAGSVCKKNARRTNHAAGAEAASVRPDLKRAAQARAAALSKGIRTAKAAAAGSQ
ncbi:60S ribosomal L28-1 [Micractinium conductrix]|uniref:60S ribosomal L28-1 n=1 Tax=Micractinium conductrix TaxID=554055 RepID=A0A2P6VHT2_9CHLO|nr:60S ribosomal L28-1 [Micractinium conductrix]|eukprot:PSC73656.1 60S ribosomal L28-1 [Micractinium conductrix]